MMKKVNKVIKIINKMDIKDKLKTGLWVQICST